MTHRPGKLLRLPAAKLSLVLFVSQYLDRGLITENIIEAHVILEFQVIVIAQNYCSYARYQYFGTRITVRFFYSGLYHAEAVISIDFSGRDFHVSRTVQYIHTPCLALAEQADLPKQLHFNPSPTFLPPPDKTEKVFVLPDTNFKILSM